MRSLALASCVALLLAGCGARTGLPWGNDESPFSRYDLDDDVTGVGGSGGTGGVPGTGAFGGSFGDPDGGDPDGETGTGGGGTSGTFDAGTGDAESPDADFDAEPELDADVPDASEPELDADVPDASEPELDADVPDASEPELDAGTPDAGDADVVKLGCDDPNETQIYAITVDQELLSFYPPTGTFSLVTKLDCPSSSTPFSMAVARSGVAYSVFMNGELFRIHTGKGTCAATPYVIGQQGFTRFGMGFSSDENVATESLFIASSASINGAPELARLDLDTLSIGGAVPMAADLTAMELTGTGDGRLYGFVATANGVGTRLVQLNKSTGEHVVEASFPSLPLGNGWAFAFWGGDFWFFTSVGANAVVTRFEPSTQKLSQVATWPSRIVGAGVSTCAPEN